MKAMDYWNDFLIVWFFITFIPLMMVIIGRFEGLRKALIDSILYGAYIVILLGFGFFLCGAYYVYATPATPQYGIGIAAFGLGIISYGLASKKSFELKKDIDAIKKCLNQIDKKIVK